MNRQQQGFTLIELMIVVAIIGILAAISIPIYQSNTLKTQINRVIGELGSYKPAFEIQVTNGRPVTNTELGYVPSDLTTGDVAANIGVANPDGSGHMEVTMGGNSDPTLDGLVIRFQRSVNGHWRCEIDRSAVSEWKDAYRPQRCAVL